MESGIVVPVLVEVYAEIGIAADQLPYTDEFETIYAEVVRQTDAPLTRAQLWRIIANARKSGALPRVRR